MFMHEIILTFFADPKTQILTQEPKKLLHVAARRSPYPGTSIRRFPVFDKFVPWEVGVVLKFNRDLFL